MPAGLSLARYPGGMAAAPHKPSSTVHAPHVIPPPPPGTSAALARNATVSALSAASSPPPQPAVYQPWTQLLAHAESRYKAEITAGLAALDRAAADAGQLLDRAAAMAAEAGGHLERAAWDAWSKYMAAADRTRNDILDRARTEYDQAIAYAHGQYDKAMGDAEATYNAIVRDANRAQSDVKAIAS